MLKTFALAAAIACLAATAALAGPCDSDLVQIDTAIASKNLSPDQKAQAQDMRKQAGNLCKAGHGEEAADVVAELKALLAIE